MKTYKCTNPDCSEFGKKLQKETNYKFINGKMMDTSYVCEECGQQMDVTEDLRHVKA